jgi:hypothetical protein
MKIPAIGALRPHPDVPEWQTSDPIEIPYFDGKKFAIILEVLEDSDEEDVQSAIVCFLNLGPKDRLRASQYVFANYREIANLVSKEDLGCQIASKEDVWEHVHPSEIFVSKRDRRDRAIYIQITAECDWEPEHGLQIIYRRGAELSRVSDQDGHLTHTDAYDLPEDQDRIA